MQPPRRIWRVDWLVARSYENPDDMVERRRLYTSLDTVARQVRSFASWPTHVTLIGVWRAVGGHGDDLEWTEVAIEDLPPVPREVEEHYAAQEAARAELAERGVNVILNVDPEVYGDE